MHESGEARAAPLLSVRGLSAGYGHVAVLEGIDLEVAAGRICAVVGGNGAGKSTLLKTISGLLVPTAGEIRFDGRPIGGIPPRRIVDMGLLHVAEGRRLFRQQSVADNLELGLYGAGLSRSEERARFEQVYAMFPILAEKRSLAAGGLSGGQQQMLAIGRALMTNPDLIVLDEATEGLAPLVVREIWRIVASIRESGIASLVVDRNYRAVLAHTERCVVLERGRVVLEGSSESLAADERALQTYLGV